jgi:hypothetical protein
MNKRGKLDIYLGKLMSRKLLAVFIATIGLFTSHVSDNNWIIMMTVYISVEGATNIVRELKKTNTDGN